MTDLLKSANAHAAKAGLDEAEKSLESELRAEALSDGTAEVAVDVQLPDKGIFDDPTLTVFGQVNVKDKKGAAGVRFKTKLGRKK